MLLRTRCAGSDRPGARDQNVTTFCHSVTPRCEAVISSVRRFDTKVMGEAMAPASEYQPTGGKRSGAGAALVTLLALFACGDDNQQASTRVDTPARGSSEA